MKNDAASPLNDLYSLISSNLPDNEKESEAAQSIRQGIHRIRDKIHESRKDNTNLSISSLIEAAFNSTDGPTAYDETKSMDPIEENKDFDANDKRRVDLPLFDVSFVYISRLYEFVMLLMLLDWSPII